MLPFSPEQSLPDRFERTVELHADRPAVVADAGVVTYAELNAAANRLAHRLLAMDAVPQTRVAILMRHDGPLFAAVLAVVKAGKVAVVLNPTDPFSRQEAVLRHAEPAAVMCDAGNCDGAAGLGEVLGVKVVRIDDAGHGTLPADNPTLHIPPTDLAFLIYTSGSTGVPKAVMQPHRNIIHNILRYTISMQLTHEDRILSLASLSGGQGVATAWQALLNGAAIVPFAAMEKGVMGLADLITRHRVSIYISAASLFRHFMQTLPAEQRFPSVRIVRLGSESASADAFASFKTRFEPHARLFQTLSASETGNVTQHVLTHVAPPPGGQLPVGRPSHEMQVVLVDGENREVPPGEAGEILVRGRYLSPGYWRDESLTAARFSAQGDGVRVFHTGDLGRFEDGVLHFLGRKDQQIKVRGYRVELAEVEAALLRVPEVKQAVVVSRVAQEAGTMQLVAYVALHAKDSALADDANTGPKAGATEALRRALEEKLPRHMIPSAFVLLESFPMNAHGKIDRAALPAPPPVASTSEPAKTATESTLTEIWEGAFHRVVGREDNFFELGGDSLSAAVIAARLFAARQVELDFAAFSKHPVLCDLAAHIDAQPVSTGVPRETIPVVARQGPLPLSFAQERIFNGCRAGTPDGYTLASVYRISGPLQVEVFSDCLRDTATQYENFRTTFAVVDGKPAQVVHPAAPIDLPLVNLEADPRARERANEVFREKSAVPFDLGKLPLLRFFLVRLSADEHWLIRVSHHIISDAWSWGLFFRRMARAYEARVGKLPAPPPLAGLQYADYAAWQRQTLHPESAEYREQVEWWRKQVAGGVAARLPFRRGRVSAKWLEMTRQPRADEGVIWWGLPKEASEGLSGLSRSMGITPFSTRLALFVALLAHQSGQRDLTIGTYVTNRTRVETQSIFGFFANLVALRFRVDISMSLEAWLREVQRVVLDAQAHAEIPSDQLAEDLRAGGTRPPKIRAIFAITDHGAPIEFGGVTLAWMDRRFEAVPWQFTLAFDQHDEASRNRATFNPFLHDAAGVRRFIERYTRILNITSASTATPLQDLFKT